jgi:predicted unusual protein kinase regulating ubiquinone biosynthesis (AarF/ABC1/UbiB family)
MVMEYIEGTPLSKVAAELSKRGVLPGSPESLLLGRGLLTALTDAYASMIFGSGIIHGDPHPGNIFVLAEGNVALLDCGQVKQLSTKGRMNLANLIIMINDWEVVNKRLGNVMRKQGQASIDLDRSAEEVEEDKQSLEKLTKKLADTVRSYGECADLSLTSFLFSTVRLPQLLLLPTIRLDFQGRCS